jgi:hypothetical protein
LIKLIPSMGTQNQRSNYKQHASGRDGVSGTGHSGTRRMKSVETSSSRGIVYPEDIELQGDSDSDKGVRTENSRISRILAEGNLHGRTQSVPDKLGFQPAVRTEIATGTPLPASMRADRGIEVKRDFYITKGFS